MNCPKTHLSYDGDECEDCEFHVFDYRGLRCGYESKCKEIEKLHWDDGSPGGVLK